MDYEKRMNILSASIDLINECDGEMLHQISRLISYRMQRLDDDEKKFYKSQNGHRRDLRLERNWLTIGPGIETYVVCASEVNMETAISMLTHDYRECDEETLKLMIEGLNVFIEFGVETYYTGLIKNKQNGGSDEAIRSKAIGVYTAKMHRADEDQNLS